jgi:Lipocalin-like domain
METENTRSHTPLSAGLVGTWKLLSREDHTHAGERRIDPSLGTNPIGLVIFDNKGNFAAQFMKRDRGVAPEAEAAKLPSNNSRARGGYDAYFGTYSVDDSSGVVTTRLAGALSPENVGQVFTRNMSISGDELTIRLETTSVAGEPIRRTLRWKLAG